MNQKGSKIDFIGIGAQRSGTTWIAECLREHPQICLASPKEINFFDSSKYKLGLDWYGKHFVIKKEYRFFGEYTSTYIYSQKAAQRIKNHFPGVKIIVSLRNPIDRFFSHLSPDKKYDFDKELSKEKIDLVERGFYYKHLRVFFDLFPKENILVMIYEDIKKDPRSFISAIYKFIGADSSFVPDCLEKRINPKRDYKFPLAKRLLNSIINFIEKRKSSVYLRKFLIKIGMRNLFYAFDKAISRPVKKIVIGDGLKKRMREIYREDVKKLETLINRELWKDTSV